MTKYMQKPAGWWQDSKGRMQPPGCCAAVRSNRVHRLRLRAGTEGRDRGGDARTRA